MKSLSLLLFLFISTICHTQVGINTTDPTATLDVNGTTRLRAEVYDSNNDRGADGDVLSATPIGVRWVPGRANYPSSVGVLGNFSNKRINQPTFTGSYIDLDPGKWQVTVTMLLVLRDNASGAPSNATRTLQDDEAYWIRTTFTDSDTDNQPTNDFQGSIFYSGALTGPQRFGIIFGSLILNNASGTVKRYYYWTQNSDVNGSNGDFNAELSQFASPAWGENQIIAQPIN